MKDFEINEKYGSWFRLDNSAAVYPMLITLKAQSLFRLGVALNECVDRDDLERALKTTFKRYPSFEVELSQGFFRHYFVSNKKKPIIRADDGSLLKRIDFRYNRGYLLRVTYYKTKIFVDFFHGLCDGTSAMEFLKTLLYYYFKERGVEYPHMGKIKTLENPLNLEEFKDGFKEHYTEFDIAKGIKNMKGEGAFPVKDTLFKKEGFGLIQGAVETDKLIALSRKYNCSLTVFLASIAMLSVAETYYKGNANKDLVVFIPINLRRFYPSESIYNFTSFAKCRINPKTVSASIESYSAVIKDQLKKQLSKEELDLKLSFTSLMDKKPYLKFMPLFIKSFIAKLAKILTGSAQQTMIISNLGNVQMPEGYEKHIDSFLFNLNCGGKTPNNMAISTFNNKTIISFTRQLVSTEIERKFFTTLSGMGLDIKITSNLREEDKNEM
ncbi:MAG: hypothetical protein ACOCWI_00275 [Bacillota bacterium]